MTCCLHCEAPVEAFEAFCSPACQERFRLDPENTCHGCHGCLVLAGYTRRGTPALRCVSCKGFWWWPNEPEKLVVVPAEKPRWFPTMPRPAAAPRALGGPSRQEADAAQEVA